MFGPSFSTKTMVLVGIAKSFNLCIGGYRSS
ncbi:MAG: hypothetical protein ACI9YU_000239 [Flavobacteriales bacterium]|jgi:hypothetical protein